MKSPWEPTFKSSSPMDVMNSNALIIKPVSSEDNYQQNVGRCRQSQIVFCCLHWIAQFNLVNRLCVVTFFKSTHFKSKSNHWMYFPSLIMIVTSEFCYCKSVQIVLNMVFHFNYWRTDSNNQDSIGPNLLDVIQDGILHKVVVSYDATWHDAWKSYPYSCVVFPMYPFKYWKSFSIGT